jgi:hypothetical protein
MHYELSAEAGYLLAKVADRRTAEDVMEFYQAVADECDRSGLNRVLVESYETEAPPLLGLRDCAAKLQHLFRDRRVAGFYADADVFNLAAEFVQLVTNSRGITNRMFNDRDAALRWLLQGNTH